MNSNFKHVDDRHESDLKIFDHCSLTSVEQGSIGTKEQAANESVTSSTKAPISGRPSALIKVRQKKRSATRRATSNSLENANPTRRPAKELVKLKDAAYMLDISVPTMRRLLKRGFFTPIKVLRHTLLRVDELLDFIEQASNRSHSPTEKRSTENGAIQNQ